MVHELTLTLPVKSRNPKPSPLFHTLRNCNISALDFDVGTPGSFLDTPTANPLVGVLTARGTNR